MPQTRRRKPARWPVYLLAGVAAAALAAGYAATSTDTGHRGGSPDFALEHTDKLIDFAHRAVHQMAVTAKAVTAAYYERGWGTLSGSEPLALARETYELLVYGDSDWDWRNFNADTDFDTAVERIGPLMNSNDADIGEFVERDGKLLLYHGWNDPGTPPGGTIRYYDDLRDTLGDAASEASVRLFMVPGMNHCGGGTGTDRFDAVAALDRWMASDSPPASLAAERTLNGETVRTRPLCPYPSVATYDGTGSTDDASKFSCR
jgi:feruloyl esterase